MSELPEIIDFVSKLPTETINSLAGLAAVVVAGLAIWVVHKTHKKEDR